MGRVKHIAYVVSDLDASARFYEEVLGFRRYGDERRPGNYPGMAVDLTDGELNLTLLRPNPDVPRLPWAYGTAGPNHIGVEVEDVARVLARLEERGIPVYGKDPHTPPRFLKFRDPDGVEVDVATPDRGWPIP